MNTQTQQFEQWYHRFDRYVHILALRYGIQDIEGAVADVWAAFWERNAASNYDPKRVKQTTYLWNIAVPRFRGWRDREKRHQHGALAEKQSYVEDFDGGLLIASAREALRAVSPAGTRDLVALFDLLREGYSQREIAQRMGVANSTVNLWLRDLRRLPEVRALLP